jgi:hypothetical protein
LQYDEAMRLAAEDVRRFLNVGRERGDPRHRCSMWP